MNAILNFIILAALVGTVISLILGVATMLRSKKSGKSNKYMMMRVGFQFLSVIVVLLLVTILR